ncbi:hypothetical protein [Candidatus Oscillochloris fontis]|uniref:hypothetical protein n=1 Tax=Candidatus Oscillochloris fontis TaxID=2496868 RepID=UPI00101BD579|nr:hypothetical protein [Candidatus Oscillochloris fontis]
MYQTESVHTYPRMLISAVAWLCTLLVVLTSAQVGFAFLRSFWGLYGQPADLITELPVLGSLVSWIATDSYSSAQLTTFGPILIEPLLLAALALFATLILRNAFPAVRTSSQGLLVEFAGSWLPIPWEHVLAVKVTEDHASEHFVLLVQTDKQHLTPWHRVYSLFYAHGMNWQPAFYITSSINDFDGLVQTMLSESERTSRASETAQPIQLQEDAQSPVFRLILSPKAFFSHKPREGHADNSARPVVAASPLGSPSASVYPARITGLVKAAVSVLVIVTILRYLGVWAHVLALEFPALRWIPLFDWGGGDPAYRQLFQSYAESGVPFMGIPDRPDLPAPWWILVAAHLMLLFSIAVIFWVSHLFPALEVRGEGIAVYDWLRRRWRLVPWQRIHALKLTEISEESQVLLLQSRALPLSQSFTSLLYDGSVTPGVVITSAISNFQPMLEQSLGQIVALEEAGGPTILQQEARSTLLWHAMDGRGAREAMVSVVRSDPDTRTLRIPTLIPAAARMALIALPPALLIVLAGLLGNVVPGWGILFAALGIWLLGMIEWPMITLASTLLDEKTGGGEDGYRAVPLYPTSQLPRLLPLIAALVVQIAGIVVLPVLAWIGAMVWTFWLARGFWEALYEWRDSQAILGGLLPIVWQLLVLIVYLVVG